MNTYRNPSEYIIVLIDETIKQFSTYFSTISSGLNSMAACILQDVIRAYFIPEMSEKQATWTSKGLGKTPSVYAQHTNNGYLL